MSIVRGALIGGGALVVAYGLTGALTDAELGLPVVFFLLGVLVAHDAVLLPLTLGAGALIGRLVPPRGQATVRVALILGLAVTLVGVPLLLGPGDGHYGRGLLILYALIGGFVAVRLRKGFHRGGSR
jgi:hypothetical protein